MKNITRLKWDPQNVEHIAKHAITPKEVEEAIFESDVLVRLGRSSYYYILGTTRSGRYIFIVIALSGRPGEAVVITARDMTKKERQYYRQRGK